MPRTGDHEPTMSGPDGARTTGEWFSCELERGVGPTGQALEWLRIITLTSGVLTLTAPTSEWLPYFVNAAFGIAQLGIGAFALYMTLRYGPKRFQGEVAIMRGNLFLRMSPRVDYARNSKPTRERPKVAAGALDGQESGAARRSGRSFLRGATCTPPWAALLY
jgi:hypothetical protein